MKYLKLFGGLGVFILTRRPHQSGTAAAACPNLIAAPFPWMARMMPYAIMTKPVKPRNFCLNMLAMLANNLQDKYKQNGRKGRWV